MKDYRLRIDFLDNHKIVKLKRRHGSAAIEYLLRLYSYTRVHRPSGILDGMTEEDIEIATGWDKKGFDNFLKDLIDLKLLDKSENTYIVHDWAEHQAYATGTKQRSDRARFNKLAQSYPELHAILKEKGYRAISSEDYHHQINCYLGTATANASKTLAPSPSPSPSPSQTPSPAHTSLSSLIEELENLDLKRHSSSPTLDILIERDQLINEVVRNSTETSFYNKLNFTKLIFTLRKNNVSDLAIINFLKEAGVKTLTSKILVLRSEFIIKEGQK